MRDDVVKNPMSDSPYAPPTATVADLPTEDQSAAVQTRSAHHRHEVQLKSIGSLYYLSCLMLFFASLPMLLTLNGRSNGFELGVLALLALLGLACAVLGYGLRRLRPWAHLPSGVLSGIGLLAFPAGTLINAWALYLLFCAKGRTVLAADYQQIIDATPHIKYRRSVGDWIAVVLLLLIIVAVAAAIVMGSMGR